MTEWNTAEEIAAARASFQELGVGDFLHDPLFTVGVISQELGQLGTIGCTAALSHHASLTDVRQRLALIAAIATEALDVLAAEKPRIVVPGQ